MCATSLCSVSSPLIVLIADFRGALFNLCVQICLQVNEDKNSTVEAAIIRKPTLRNPFSVSPCLVQAQLQAAKIAPCYDINISRSHNFYTTAFPILYLEDLIMFSFVVLSYRTISAMLVLLLLFNRPALQGGVN